MGDYSILFLFFFFLRGRYLNQTGQKQFIVAVPFILMDNDHEEMANYFLDLLEKEASKQVRQLGKIAELIWHDICLVQYFTETV